MGPLSVNFRNAIRGNLHRLQAFRNPARNPFVAALPRCEIRGSKNCNTSSPAWLENPVMKRIRMFWWLRYGCLMLLLDRLFFLFLLNPLVDKPDTAADQQDHSYHQGNFSQWLDKSEHAAARALSCTGWAIVITFSQNCLAVRASYHTPPENSAHEFSDTPIAA